MDEKLVVYIDAITTGFQKALENATKNLKNFGENMEQAGTRLSVGVSLPLALLASNAVKAYGDVDALQRGVALLEKNATTLSARLKELDAIPNLGFKDAMKADVQLRTVLEQMYGIDGASKQSIKTINSFNNALKLAAKDGEVFKQAMYGVTQLANTKFPLGEDLNILKDAIPQITPLLNEAFGVSRSEDFQKLKISSKQVLDTIVDGLSKLPKAAIGVKQSIDDFAERLQMRLSQLGGMIARNIDLEAVFSKIIGFIDGLMNAFDRLSPAAQKTVLVIGGLAIALPPIMALLGGFITTILPALKAGFLALTSPIGLITVAIAAAATAIISNWDAVKKVLVDSGAWSILTGLVKHALGFVMDIFQVFKGLFTGNWSEMWGGVKNILKRAWNGIITVATEGVKAFLTIQSKLFSAIGLDKLSAGSQNMIQYVDKMAESFKAKVPEATSAINMLKDAFNGFRFGGNRDVPGQKDIPILPSQEDIEKEIKEWRDNFGKGIEKAKIIVNDFSQLLIDGIKKRQGDVKSAVTELFSIDPAGMAQIYNDALNGKDFGAKFRDRLTNFKIPKINLTSDDTVFTNAINDFAEKLAVKFGAFTIPPDVFNNLKASLKKGMSLEDAFTEITNNLQSRFNLVKDSIMQSINAVAEITSQGIASLINPNIDFSKSFKQILGNLLNSLGTMVIAYGTQLLVTKELIDKALAALTIPTAGPGAAIALIGLGVALKGIGSAIAQSNQASSGSTSVNSNNNAPAYGYGNQMGLPQTLNIKIDGQSRISSSDIVLAYDNAKVSWG